MAINCKNSKYPDGFTLAEVLITLVIIGIIAAMTIPAVINSMNNANYKSAYRKAYADFSNVFREDIAYGQLPIKNGNCYDVDFAEYTYNKLKEKFNVANACENANAYDCWVQADTVYNDSAPTNNARAFVDASGRVWIEFARNRGLYLVDTNGDLAPNEFGKDRWLFAFFNYNSTHDCVLDPTQPIRIMPYTLVDYPRASAWCNYPPCYYIKWLIE